jgi:aspartyl-tRNA(Asn)/glutamyl-tRNA(Gln) amidotransferase subunit C
MLTQDDTKKLATLARIALSPEELEKYTQDISKVLEYVEALQAVDVSGVEEVSQVTGLVNVQREDVAIHEDNREEILARCPTRFIFLHILLLFL